MNEHRVQAIYHWVLHRRKHFSFGRKLQIALQGGMGQISPSPPRVGMLTDLILRAGTDAAQVLMPGVREYNGFVESRRLAYIFPMF